MITYPTRLDLIKALPAGSLLAEIGSYRGYFAIQILNECHNVSRLWLVDPWKNYDGYVDTINGENQEENMRQCMYHIRGHLPGGRVKVIRGMSVDVATTDKTIPPLDAVYIDGNHSYEACFGDLVAWSNRLKPSGVILGHDYTRNATAEKLKFGVIEAVTDFCDEYGWELTALTAEDFASYRLEKKK